MDASKSDTKEAPAPLAYWLCQVMGWGVYGVVETVAATQTLHLPVVRAAIEMAVLLVLGLALTHVLRGFLRRHAWARLPIRTLVPRALAAAAVLAIPMTVLIRYMSIAAMWDPEQLAAGELPPGAQIEDLFSHLELIAPALGAAGVLILLAGLLTRRRLAASDDLSYSHSAIVGMVQGLCLPFRGFSRSGATISTGMLLGVARRRVEAFSFALAVVLTPAVIAREAWRLLRTGGSEDIHSAVGFSLLGALVAFIAGLVALRWLSRWLETDRWYLFGIYCLAAAAFTGYLHVAGY